MLLLWSLQRERGLTVGQCAGAASSASSATPATPATPAASSQATKHVSILNRDMTDAEIRAEVAKEGSIVIANWTYTANDEIIKQFTKYVKDNFGRRHKGRLRGHSGPDDLSARLSTLPRRLAIPRRTT